MSLVTVVSYGAGNVASVQFALERLGAVVRLTADPSEIAPCSASASASSCCSRPARKAAASRCSA